MRLIFDGPETRDAVVPSSLIFNLQPPTSNLPYPTYRPIVHVGIRFVCASSIPLIVLMLTVYLALPSLWSAWLQQVGEKHQSVEPIFDRLVALLAYEIIITIDGEVELVWKRRWTATSFLLLTTRWVMILNVIFTLVPGTPQVSYLLVIECCEC